MQATTSNMSDGREILVGFMWWIVWCFSGVDYVMYSGVYSRMASEMASGMASATMTTTMTTKPEHLYLPNLLSYVSDASAKTTRHRYNAGPQL